MPLKNAFTILIHGDAGVGKSRLAASGEPPLLVLDLEGRGRRLPGRKVYWDVFTENPPQYDGTWDICVALTTKFSGVDRAFQWLQTDRHQFKTVAFDSLTFAQKRFIDDLAGTAQLKQDAWGEVLRKLENTVRDFCDLPLHQNNTVETVAFTVGTKNLEGRRVPLLQGGLRDTAAYMYDAVGYLYIAPDSTGQDSRNLLVAPSAGIVAKDGTDLLGGPVIPNPVLSELTARLIEPEGTPA